MSRKPPLPRKPLGTLTRRLADPDLRAELEAVDVVYGLDGGRAVLFSGSGALEQVIVTGRIGRGFRVARVSIDFASLDPAVLAVACEVLRRDCAYDLDPADLAELPDLDAVLA